MSYSKVIILGNSGVGKTSILARLIEDTFMERSLPTIGIDFRIKTTTITGNK
jgi:GTPase SAR1 family protein